MRRHLGAQFSGGSFGTRYSDGSRFFRDHSVFDDSELSWCSVTRYSFGTRSLSTHLVSRYSGGSRALGTQVVLGYFSGRGCCRPGAGCAQAVHYAARPIASVHRPSERVPANRPRRSSTSRPTSAPPRRRRFRPGRRSSHAVSSRVRAAAPAPSRKLGLPAVALLRSLLLLLVLKLIKIG